MTEPVNPYAAPQADLQAFGPQDVSDSEQLRTRYLQHEGALRAVGLAYGTVGIIWMGAPLLALTLVLPANAISLSTMALFATAFALGASMLVMMWGLRGLHPWIRQPVAVALGVGVLGFCVGTVFVIHFLTLVLQPSTLTVTSRKYRTAISQTPQLSEADPASSYTMMWVIAATMHLLLWGGILAQFGNRA